MISVNHYKNALWTASKNIIEYLKKSTKVRKDGYHKGASIISETHYYRNSYKCLNQRTVFTKFNANSFIRLQSYDNVLLNN